MEYTWSEIRDDFEDDGFLFIDAWETGDDMEEGTIIAKIDLSTGEVTYNDERAKVDVQAQEVIQAALKRNSWLFN